MLRWLPVAKVLSQDYVGCCRSGAGLAASNAAFGLRAVRVLQTTCVKREGSEEYHVGMI